MGGEVMAILIDTDVLIEYLRDKEAIVSRLVDAYKRGKRLCFSPITRAEIAAGLRKNEEEITQRLFAVMECLKIDDSIGLKAGEYMKTFRASHSAEIADALIAATAHQNDIPLWTLNRKHYPMKDIEFYG
jgi:predicted nucleic acid-binding protein